MAFRKRNVAVQRSAAESEETPPLIRQADSVPGVRPSPLTGQPVISTGLSSLDSHLGGHAGIVLGSSLLIEESGTTDFSGAVLKFFAAEGIAQGHHVHVVGVGQQWTRELPGLSTSTDRRGHIDRSPSSSDDKMKIAWRYERLGQHNANRPGGVISGRNKANEPSGEYAAPVFCHTFDLAKKLTIGQTATINHIPIAIMAMDTQSPFDPVVMTLLKLLQSASSTTIHRIVIPSLLSPAFYPSHAASPGHLLNFFHSLRAMQRTFSERVVLMATLPTDLYSRTSGVIRWAEHLVDGVMELQPFPHIMDSANSLAESGGARVGEEQPQGLLKFHKLPALTERGASSAIAAGVGDDLAFTLSRRRFVIKPFSLPPMEQDEGDKSQTGGSSESGGMKNIKKADIEF